MKPETYIWGAIFLPLLLAGLLPVLGRRMGRRVGWVALCFPVISVLSIILVALQTEALTRPVVGWVWVPVLGLNFTFLMDGLSLLFGLIVSGMGVLIFLYANFYLDDHYKHHGRFYGYLTLFMAAMLGTVFSNHFLLLFIFWELTGVASFLLIGFLHEKSESRVGARQALMVTAGTGLVMLVGIILVGQVGGGYALDQLLADKLPWEEHRTLLNWALVLVMIGAFGKSAQIPFHFWLPNAMAAPTPVSAYLHSATMVKLGVFLAARVFPMFVESPVWGQLLVPVGFATMALGAVLALLSNDLKAILAFSTVSALGSFIGYYGLGSVEGVTHDMLHILNHVFYKGCLFMVVGIVAHATGLRDIRQLGGLMKRLPLLGVVCLVAAASMAGLPGTLGFISKEALLEEVFHAPARMGWLGWFAVGAVLVASTAKVAFSVRLFFNIFRGREPEGSHFHAPGLGLQLPPLILAGAALWFGLVPTTLEPFLQRMGSLGLNPAPAHLAIWHGLTMPLLASTLVILGGVGIYLAGQKAQWRWAELPGWIRFDDFFERGLTGLGWICERAMVWLRFDRPLDYLPILLTFCVVVTGGYMWVHFNPFKEGVAVWEELVIPKLYTFRVMVVILMTLAVMGVVLLKRWTTQLISLSIVGFLVTFYFVLYQAPDLALTQILVDTALLVLILILLGRFPRRAEQGEITGRYPAGRRLFNVSVSVGVGVVMTMFTLIMTAPPGPDRMGQRFLDTTLELAKGSNTVNTILVDYRGFDTLFEVTVLFIALLACLGLVTRYKRTDREFRRGPLEVPGHGLHKDDGRSER